MFANVYLLADFWHNFQLLLSFITPRAVYQNKEIIALLPFHTRQIIIPNQPIIPFTWKIISVLVVKSSVCGCR